MPHIEALRHNRRLNAALSAITAAVVGVVLNLAVWFAVHTIFTSVTEAHRWGMRLLVPNPASIDWAALGLATIAMIATFRLHLGMLKVLAVCTLGGIAIRLIWP